MRLPLKTYGSRTRSSPCVQRNPIEFPEYLEGQSALEYRRSVITGLTLEKRSYTWELGAGNMPTAAPAGGDKRRNRLYKVAYS